MEFPHIETIEDIRPFLGDNFPIHEKTSTCGQTYQVIDYILNSSEYFNCPEQKECRGIIFDKDGKIIRRPLHKFFNLNERPETTNLDIKEPHVILEKLDGSMIAPFLLGDRIIWGSKAGETFLTPMVEEFVDKHRDYINFTRTCFERGLTPIFEFCTDRNRIVLPYDVERLVLLATRYNVTGEYIFYGEIAQHSSAWPQLEVVGEGLTYDKNIVSLKDIETTVRGMIGIEGFVIRFSRGHMVKLKCNEYVLHHKAKESIQHEKNVVAILSGGTADDFRVLLSDHDRGIFETFEVSFWAYLDTVVDTLWKNHRDFFNSTEMSRKDFALCQGKLLTPTELSIYFTFFDKRVHRSEVKQEVINRIFKACSSQTTIDRVRPLFGVKWVY